jgi:hypothetical protein
MAPQLGFLGELPVRAVLDGELVRVAPIPASSPLLLPGTSGPRNLVFVENATRGTWEIRGAACRVGGDCTELRSVIGCQSRERVVKFWSSSHGELWLPVTKRSGVRRASLSRPASDGDYRPTVSPKSHPGGRRFEPG